MIIGLDYDDTFTRDPDGWYTAMMALKSVGHTIVGVTLRNQAQVIEDERYFSVCDWVVYCAGQSKDKLLKEAFATVINVWIDDTPVFINYSWEDLHGAPFMGHDPKADYMVPLKVDTRDYTWERHNDG